MFTILLLMLVGAASAWVLSFIFSSSPKVKDRCKEADKAADEAAEAVGVGCLSGMCIMGLVVIVLIVLLVRSCS